MRRRECTRIFVTVNPFISTRLDACVRGPAASVGIIREAPNSFFFWASLIGKCLFELNAHKHLERTDLSRRHMAAVGLRAYGTWTHKVNMSFTVRSRSYAAMAVKSKQKPSDSQTTPTPRNASPSPKTEPPPSDGKAKKSKSRPSSIESAAEQNLQAMESMKRFTKMYATADVWGTEMANLGMVAFLVPYGDTSYNLVRCGDTI